MNENVLWMVIDAVLFVINVRIARQSNYQYKSLNVIFAGVTLVCFIVNLAAYVQSIVNVGAY